MIWNAILSHSHDCDSSTKPSYVEVHGRRRGTPGNAVPDMFQRNHHLKEIHKNPRTYCIISWNLQQLGDGRWICNAVIPAVQVGRASRPSLGESWPSTGGWGAQNVLQVLFRCDVFFAEKTSNLIQFLVTHCDLPRITGLCRIPSQLAVVGRWQWEWSPNFAQIWYCGTHMFKRSHWFQRLLSSVVWHFFEMNIYLFG